MSFKSFSTDHGAPNKAGANDAAKPAATVAAAPTKSADAPVKPADKS